MKINVSHTATLANIPLTQQEEKTFAKQLEETLATIEKLGEVDTKGIKPTYQVTGLENITRDDKPSPSFSQQQALQNAKKTYNGFFEVPAILEKNDL